MRKLLLLAIVLVMSSAAFAQIESPVKWAYGAKRISATEAVVFLRATIDDGWHIYGLNVKDGGPIKTSFTFPVSKDYTLIGDVSEPAPTTKYESTFKMTVPYFEKTVTFQQKIKLKTAGATVVKGSLEYETCNDKKCLPPDDVDFVIPIGK
jgi:DsbC/DsbD-like thiol-disulfide interchange protein